MNVQKITPTVSLPKFSNDLGVFISQLRTRLFSTQSKAAHYFGLKSHGTISRYESETLRPPIGYVANLVRLYADKLEQEGQPPGTGHEHFLREMNRIIRQYYSWDEAPFHNWEELCIIADQFMANRQITSRERQMPEAVDNWTNMQEVNLTADETLPNRFQKILGELIGVQTLTFLFGSADKQRDLRNRQILLDLVKDFWINGIFENSLYKSVLIELGMQEKQDAVEHPWDMLLKTIRQPQQRLPPDTKIKDVFNQMGQSLLILGDPGSGKTTMLLDLARGLIEEARQNPLLPIPVVFNLSSWAGPHQSLADWLVEELHSKYKIPRRIGRPWIAKDALLPLLDGLDEVAEEWRENCVRAINHFHLEHLVPLVVCSRLADYESLTTQLELRGAVLLQPLTQEQIATYLNRLGSDFNKVRQLIQEDPWLNELVRTPLMLNIVTWTYWKGPTQYHQQPDTVDVRQKHLFDVYVTRMFERKGNRNKTYSNEQTVYKLGWLAKQMSRHNQSIFLLEQIQPSWLSNHKWQWLYIFLSRMVSMVSGGLLIGLVAGVSGVPLFGLWDTVLARPGGWLVFGLLLGVVNGLILAGIDGVRYKQNDRLPTKKSTWRQLGLKALIIGIIYGMVDGLIFWQFGNAVLGFIGGLTLGLTYGLAVVIRGSQNTILNELQTVETLRWSRQKALKGAILGGIIGVVVGIIGGWVVGLDTMLRQNWAQGPLFSLAGTDNFVVMGSLYGACLLSLIGVVFGGMESQMVESKTTPNEGIWLSIKHALVSWLGYGVIVGVGGGLLFGLFSGLQYSLSVGLALFICFGSLAALWYGGLDLIQHHILRILLWYQGHMPRRYIQFLDYTCERIFMRKVGGGYVFIHRLLLEYFAALETDQDTK